MRPYRQVVRAARRDLATFEAALRDLYFAYEDDPGGYQYLRLELRAYVCGARVGEVVVGSGGIATAI